MIETTRAAACRVERPAAAGRASAVEPLRGGAAGELALHARARDSQAPCGRSAARETRSRRRSAWTTSIEVGSATAATPSSSGRIDSEPTSSSAIRQRRPRSSAKRRRAGRGGRAGAAAGCSRYSSSPPSAARDARGTRARAGTPSGRTRDFLVTKPAASQPLLQFVGPRPAGANATPAWPRRRVARSSSAGASSLTPYDGENHPEPGAARQPDQTTVELVAADGDVGLPRP